MQPPVEVRQRGAIPADASPLTAERLFATAFSSPTSRGGFVFPRYDSRLHNGDEIQVQSAAHGTWLSFSEGAVVVGGKISFRGGKDGLFCADEPTQVSCNRESGAGDAVFDVVDAGGGRIAFRGGRSGKYCAVGQSNTMACASDVIGESETYMVEDLGGGEVALKGGQSGKYCADMGELQGVQCAGDAVTDSSGRFKPVAEGSQGAMVVQTTDQSQAGTLVVQRPDLDSPSVALLCKGWGLYLTVQSDGLLSCSSRLQQGLDFSRVDTWDARVGAFQAHEQEQADALAAYATHHTYFRALDPTISAEVTANGEDPNGWQQWNILLVAGFETVRPLIRGVNLANWFVLEKPMADDLWLQADGATPFGGQCDAIDEKSLMETLGESAGRARMEAHWESWITEDDICWLARRGLNTVRVPIGYWMVIPEAPFVSGQYRHLRNLFEWCERYNVAVLLDFHGLKGSQNGEPSSGNCGACGNDNCGSTTIDYLEYKEDNMAVIKNLTAEFSGSPVYLGFQVANDVSRTTDRNGAVEFYKEAYALIRAWSPSAIDVMAHTFGPSNYPFNNFHDVIQDQHISFPRLPGGATADQRSNINLILQELMQVERWQVVVGEWSLQSVQQWDDGFYRDFAKMQIQAFEQHAQGWFYQAYKTAYEDSKVSYRDQCERGRLPGCLEGWRLASPKWWGAPPCSYAYLDGTCPPTSGPRLLFSADPSLNSSTPLEPHTSNGVKAIAGRSVDSSGSVRGIKVRRVSSRRTSSVQSQNVRPFI